MLILYVGLSFIVGGFAGYILAFPKNSAVSATIEAGGSPHHHLVRTRIVNDDWGVPNRWVADCSCGQRGVRCRSEEDAVARQQKHAELFRKANEIEAAPAKPAVEAEPPQYIF